MESSSINTEIRKTNSEHISQVSTYFIRMNQKRDGQDTPLKSKKLREAIAYQLIKRI